MTRHITDIDEVLTTTRTVRFRMDFDRPVEDDVITECLGLAQQATVGSNQEYWRAVVVTDPLVKGAIAQLYRQVWDETVAVPLAEGQAATVTRLSPTVRAGDEEQRRQQRILDGVKYLVDNLERVPALVMICSEAPTPRKGMGGSTSGYYGSIYPFAWSFQLACRSRGLGTVLSTALAHKSAEVGEVLGLPDGCHLITMIPVAYTQGLEFKKGARRPLEEIVHWNQWVEKTTPTTIRRA